MERYLEKMNFHWFDEKDPVLEEFEKMKIKIIPSWLRRISLEEGSVNILLGPRRVGKTTGLKLLVRDLMKKGVDAMEIAYIDCDLIPTLEAFQKVLDFSVREFKYILLDEVTSIEKWWKPIRGFSDLGLLKDKVLVITGSMSIKIRREAELLPGRRGQGKIIEVLPLSYPEVFSVLFKKPKFENLEKAFSIYLEKGGFPASLNDKKGFEKEVIEAFESEILKTGLSVKTAYEIIKTLLHKVPSALSYSSISSEIGIDYKTVRNYLERFEDMYMLKIAYLKENKKVFFRKEKKMFLRDPFIARSFALWTDSELRKDALYEWIVQEHLLRKFGEIYYYRNKFEIDCIAGGLKVEVKAGKPHRRYPRGVIVLDEEDLPRFLMELFEPQVLQ